jgi:hypothetical protein
MQVMAPLRLPREPGRCGAGLFLVEELKAAKRPKDLALMPAQGGGARVACGAQIQRIIEKRLHASQFAFARDALVWLGRTFYLVFKFTASLRQLLNDFI